MDVRSQLLEVMRDRNASGLKELADVIGVTTDDIKNAALLLSEEGLLSVSRRYDSSWRITNPNRGRNVITVDEKKDNESEETLEEWIDTTQLTAGDLLRIRADLQDEIEIVQRELSRRGVL